MREREREKCYLGDRHRHHRLLDHRLHLSDGSIDGSMQLKDLRHLTCRDQGVGCRQVAVRGAGCRQVPPPDDTRHPDPRRQVAALHTGRGWGRGIDDALGGQD